MIGYIIAGIAVFIVIFLVYCYKIEEKELKKELAYIDELISKYPKGSKYVVTEYIPFAEMALEPGAVGEVIDHNSSWGVLLFHIGEHFSKRYWIEEKLLINCFKKA